MSAQWATGLFCFLSIPRLVPQDTLLSCLFLYAYVMVWIWAVGGCYIAMCSSWWFIITHHGFAKLLQSVLAVLWLNLEAIKLHSPHVVWSFVVGFCQHTVRQWEWLFIGFLSGLYWRKIALKPPALWGSSPEPLLLPSPEICSHPSIDPSPLPSNRLTPHSSTDPSLHPSPEPSLHPSPDSSPAPPLNRTILPSLMRAKFLW